MPLLLSKTLQTGAVLPLIALSSFVGPALTVGTFIGQALKSSQGQEDWLRFFTLMGTAIALRERRPPVPDTPANRKELITELRQYAKSLNVTDVLRAFGRAMQTLTQPSAEDAHYYLVSLNSEAKTVTVEGFKQNETERASQRYLELERSLLSQPGADAVLVSVESLELLQKAYPNYFLDTDLFIGIVEEVLQ